MDINSLSPHKAPCSTSRRSVNGFVLQSNGRAFIVCSKRYHPRANRWRTPQAAHVRAWRHSATSGKKRQKKKRHIYSSANLRRTRV